jgi:hypothetical protein
MDLACFQLAAASASDLTHVLGKVLDPQGRRVDIWVDAGRCIMLQKKTGRRSVVGRREACYVIKEDVSCNPLHLGSETWSLEID